MSISRETLAKYISPGCFFLETGTKWGDTAIRAKELGAAYSWTIERDSLMAALAHCHCNDALPYTRYGCVVFRVICCDSPAALYDPSAIEYIAEGNRQGRRTVVFLDAHDEHKSPILRELEAIAEWQGKADVILIDDRRCWDGWGIQEQQVRDAIAKIGQYDIGFDTGVAPEDILVARRIV